MVEGMEKTPVLLLHTSSRGRARSTAARVACHAPPTPPKSRGRHAIHVVTRPWNCRQRKQRHPIVERTGGVLHTFRFRVGGLPPSTLS